MTDEADLSKKIKLIKDSYDWSWKETDPEYVEAMLAVLKAATLLREIMPDIRALVEARKQIPPDTIVFRGQQAGHFIYGDLLMNAAHFSDKGDGEFFALAANTVTRIAQKVGECQDLQNTIIRLHVEGVLSEGQAAKATGLDRVEIRKRADEMAQKGSE